MLDSAHLNSSSCTLQGNSAARGGAYWIGGSAVFVDEGTFVLSNSANEGAGLYLSSGYIILQSMHIDGNQAYHQGGGLYVTIETSLALKSSTLQ